MAQQSKTYIWILKQQNIMSDTQNWNNCGHQYSLFVNFFITSLSYFDLSNYHALYFGTTAPTMLWGDVNRKYNIAMDLAVGYNISLFFLAFNCLDFVKLAE